MLIQVKILEIKACLGSFRSSFSIVDSTYVVSLMDNISTQNLGWQEAAHHLIRT